MDRGGTKPQLGKRRAVFMRLFVEKIAVATRICRSRRVLVFRIGSLGDTCVAIPAFRLIRSCFAKAEIRVLTNFPVADGVKAPPLASIIGPSGLVDGYIEYPLGLKRWNDALHLRKMIRQWQPDIVINLMPVRSRGQQIRDFLFFRGFLGISASFGFSLARIAQEHLWIEKEQLFEPEAQRLLRNLAPLGAMDLGDETVWDLGLQETEIERAKEKLRNWPGASGFIACSVGAKWDSKDWGQDRWEDWAEEASKRFPGHGLVLIGAAVELERSASVARRWCGPTLNLCGLMAPRESAAIIRYAKCMVGHDSGPMHLAAAVTTPCVAIFSAQDKQGVWFPHGKHHQVLYHKTECAGCRLEVCAVHGKKCMRSITVNEVIHAMQKVLADA